MARQRSSKPSSTPVVEETSLPAIGEGDADLRAQVWDLHLRGWTFRAIGREVGMRHETAARMVRQTYGEVGRDRRESLETALDEAIARLRAIQRQAWADHDTDDEREAAVLAPFLPAAAGGSQHARQAARYPDDGAPPPSIRFNSQRAAYLRLALDCEKEIARLQGLYGLIASPEEAPQVVFRIERVDVHTSPAPSMTAIGDQQSIGDHPIERSPMEAEVPYASVSDPEGEG